MKTKNQTMVLSMLVAGMTVGGSSLWPALAASAGCGAVLTSDTTLQSDLDCSGSEAALVIGADHITVNLNGHTLVGDYAGIGIDNTGGFDQVTIKNGTLKGFTEGIRAVEADGFRVSNVEVLGAMGPGLLTGAIHILGGNDVQIRNCTINVDPIPRGPHGIRLDSVQNVLVQNAVIEGGMVGVSFFSIGPEGDPGVGAPTTGRIQGCSIRNSFQSGVLLGNTDNAWVTDNDLSGHSNLAMQIGFNYVSNIHLSGNAIHDNLAGVVTLGTSESVLSKNSFTDNELYGLNINEECVNNVVSENLVANNGTRGIVLISSANDNRISKNIVLDNGSDGISLFLGVNTGNSITGNISLGNGGYDLFHNEESTPNFWDNNTYDTKSGADIP